jgi:hypothetical protein
MSATSKRDRCLRDGIEPVTGKDLHQPPVVKQTRAKKKVSKKSEGEQDGG